MTLVVSLRGQDYFPIGVWCYITDQDNPLNIYSEAGGVVTIIGEERGRLTDLGVNYVVGCTNPKTEDGLVRYGDEQGITFKTTIEYAPAGYQGIGAPYAVWTYSEEQWGGQNMGNKEDDSWR